jgi:pimeloyl-ACP methyl ester carboxylesterase
MSKVPPQVSEAFRDEHVRTLSKYLLVEGHRLAYLDEGDGPPVLLIYGIPTSSLLWRDIVPALAETHRVIIG